MAFFLSLVAIIHRRFHILNKISKVKDWKILLEEFSDLFPKYSPMYRGQIPFRFECDLGWYDLIYSLCKDIRKILQKSPELKKKFSVFQVKEKFGGLRFYIGLGNEEIFDRIHKAEEESYHICEKCGKPGKLRTDLIWYKTLCEDCYRKKKEDEYILYYITERRSRNG